MSVATNACLHFTTLQAFAKRKFPGEAEIDLFSSKGNAWEEMEAEYTDATMIHCNWKHAK